MAPPSRAPAGTRRRGPAARLVEQPINARIVRGTLAARRLAASPRRVHRRPPAAAPAAGASADFDGEAPEQLAARARRGLSRPRRRARRARSAPRSWFRSSSGSTASTTRADRFTAHDPRPRRRCELRNVVAVVHGRIAAGDRGHGAPRQQRHGPRRRTTTRRDRRADRARPRLRADRRPGGLQAQPTHTLVFVSTDGGAFGALGAAHFAESSPYRHDAVAVVSLDAIAGAGRAAARDRRRPAALARSASSSGRPRSACSSRRARSRSRDRRCASCSTSASRSRSASRAPSSARGIPAVTITTLPDERRRRRRSTTREFDVSGSAELGRAAQDLIGSLDAGLELAQATTSYVYLGTPHRPGLGDPARPDRRRCCRSCSARSTSSRAAGGAGSRSRRRAQPPRPALFWGYAAALVFAASRSACSRPGEPRPLPPEPGLSHPSPVGARPCSACCCWPAGSSRASA